MPRPLPSLGFGSCYPSSLIGLQRSVGFGVACWWLGLGCQAGLGLGCSSGHLVATLVVAPPWVRSEENVLVLGTSKSRPSSGHVSVASEGQWLVSLCGWTKEVAGDWLAGFVAGNGCVRLEELTARVECI